MVFYVGRLKNIAVLTSLAAVSACSAIPKPQSAIGNIANYQSTGVAGTPVAPGSGGLLSMFNGSNKAGPTATGIQVNAYLWRATLDTLSFMPLVSADPFGGVIITDWYSPPATPNERFKANAYILSQTMSANAIKVSLFHQVLQNGQWVNASVDPATVNGLEDRILARAADLKAEAQNTKQ